MKSKKVIVLLISLTLLVSMTLPGRVVVYADQAADSGHRTGMPENEEKDTSPEGSGESSLWFAPEESGSPAPSGEVSLSSFSGIPVLWPLSAALSA